MPVDAIKPCQFEVGEKVSMVDWDSYERPINRLGQCVVKFIARDRCESGWMVTVENLNGDRHTLDSHWPQKINLDLFGHA